MQPLPAEAFPFQPSGLVIPGCPGVSERTTVAISVCRRSCVAASGGTYSTSPVNQLVGLTGDVPGPAIHPLQPSPLLHHFCLWAAAFSLRCDRDSAFMMFHRISEIEKLTEENWEVLLQTLLWWCRGGDHVPAELRWSSSLEAAGVQQRAGPAALILSVSRPPRAAAGTFQERVRMRG